MGKAIRFCALMVALLAACHEDPPPCDTLNNETCAILVPAIIGDWKLVAECQCYTLGGDMTWRKVSKVAAINFKDDCTVVRSGETGTKCNKGIYSVTKDQIEAFWTCPDCVVSDSQYNYLFDEDTLVLRIPVDEGFVGSKYYRQ